MLQVLDLFSGIGGFSLGLERAGMRTVAFCEADHFCRRVLGKHWPHIPVYPDVRQLTAAELAANGIAVDVICGGFPCQPHSVAGARRGSADERDLWPEFARLIREIRPRWVLAENVPGLRSIESGRFFGGILRDLAGTGYDAEWHRISAADVGAPHIRERVWIVAYPNIDVGKQGRAHNATQEPSWRQSHRGCCGAVDLANACGARLPPPERAAVFREGRRHEGRATAKCGWWSAEPDVGRVAYGVPSRVDRLRALGNANVPQIAEIIGQAVIAASVNTAC